MEQQGITFFKEYLDFMDDMTPEEYCEFMKLIRDLRFNGIDTKPEEVENKNVRLAWRSVRPAVIKSIANARNYNKRKKQEEAEKQPIKEIEPNEDFDTQFSNPAVIEEPKTQKPKRTREEKITAWKAAMESGQDVYGYWNRFFKTEEEAKEYLFPPSFDECVEVLKGIKDRNAMIAEANRMEKKYKDPEKYNVKALCEAVIKR